MESSQWIVLMYLVPGVGVLGMLMFALLRNYKPRRNHASSSRLGPWAASFVLLEDDAYTTETDQSEVEPIELIVPSRSVVGSAINAESSEDSEGIFGSFDF